MLRLCLIPSLVRDIVGISSSPSIDRNEMKVADNDCSELSSVELRMIWYYIRRQKWCSPQLFGPWVYSQDSLTNYKRCDAVFFDIGQDSPQILLPVLGKSLILQENLLSIATVRIKALLLNQFENLSKDFSIIWKLLFFFFDEIISESSGFPSLGSAFKNCLADNRELKSGQGRNIDIHPRYHSVHIIMLEVWSVNEGIEVFAFEPSVY